ncbi:MAG TPA: PKD domain-containing protein [Chitinophagaceae bacterium]|nr:PKD domain-containing protein [Chitinophagaceae bacterium]
MKTKFLGLIIALLLYLATYANHIVGGEMWYTFVSQSGGIYTYSVTVKLFRDLTSGTLLDNPISIAVYAKGSNARIITQVVSQSSLATLTATPGPCIINPPIVSYQVGLYTFSLSLPASQFGYTITWARCCRVSSITNIAAPSSNFGATYTAEIPGNFSEPTGPVNNSAKFLGIDTVIICAGYPFTYNFGATDADGDILTYEFCEGYTNTGGTIPNPPDPPPYSPLLYNSPYSGASPMGSGVKINAANGMISGTAPAAGIYVVTVCVKEWRNGELLATQRKDLQIKVADCDVATVTLEPGGYINCNNLTMSFSNLSPSALINSYFWDFGDLATLADSSHLAAPNYTYLDTGIYTIKVVANRNAPCSDSTTAQVKVYPGFFPDFDITGMCMNAPIKFSDRTTAAYGSVNFWRYDFGVVSISNDTSRLQSPQYTYANIGNYIAEFIVGSTKGCRDTIYKTVTVIDKPPIMMAFRDTIICNVDTVKLNASGSGAISWTPDYNILNSTSVSPFVFPKTTTVYIVEFNDNGCLNTDSVKVRVITRVNLTASNDTAICAKDPVQLFASTDGLQYAWSPDPTLSNSNILNPIATPSVTTTYQIISRIGGCNATENVVITVLPKPIVNAGNDVAICYNSTTQLNAQTNGTAFTWSNTSSLSEATVLDPIATPTSTTSYILTATDISSGCPKPSYDTVIVTVLPKVKAFAGNDTVIIASLPLQLKATGGVNYQWSPATGLNNPNIQGPIATLDGNPEYITYLVTVKDQAGCFDTASISIHVYKTGPEIFMPTGFTPNGDGRNDVFRPIYVGMKTIDYFSVYDRWGGLIYSHKQDDGQGWDGTIKGAKQNSGTFIWMVKATDVIGNVHFKKGTVLLIR